jgi:hypothetical protein
MTGGERFYSRDRVEGAVQILRQRRGKTTFILFLLHDETVINVIYIYLYSQATKLLYTMEYTYGTLEACT